MSVKRSAVLGGYGKYAAIGKVTIKNQLAYVMDFLLLRRLKYYYP